MSKNNIDVLNEKVSQLEKNCENIYDQITELRTTIQEIYSEISQSDRFHAQELLSLSSRLEDMAKHFSNNSKNSNSQYIPPAPSNINVTMSPNINPTMQNFQERQEKQEKEEKFSLLTFLNLDIKSVVFFLIVGILVVIGFFFNFTDKIHAFLDLLK